MSASDSYDPFGIKIIPPDVCERDIDFLLLEELAASPGFLHWFLARIGIKGRASLIEAARSVKTETGESDLELTVRRKAGPIRILVENKVAASFTPDQPQRYRARAQAYRGRGAVRDAITVLMAPERYFRGSSKTFCFDVRLTYEEVRNWFATACDNKARAAYKTTLLTAAIERCRSGWIAVPHAGVSAFWQAYWQTAERIAPELAMPVPKDGIPAGSNFIIFQPAGFPPDVKLKHKLRYGHVDLEFRGMGAYMGEIETRYRRKLWSGMRIERAGKSAVIRTNVEQVDPAVVSFADCEALILPAIRGAARLLKWFRRKA